MSDRCGVTIVTRSWPLDGLGRNARSLLRVQARAFATGRILRQAVTQFELLGGVNIRHRECRHPGRSEAESRDPAAPNATLPRGGLKRGLTGSRTSPAGFPG